MPWAKDTLGNYLTPAIRDVVKREVLDSAKSRSKVFQSPRIFDNLLSSQPLCFNLFGELQQDLELATSVFRDLTDGRVRSVTGIEFEYSPGRQDLRYTNDGTAFDVYVEYISQDEQGFIGIEVKYHEDLSQDIPADRDHSHYRMIAQSMGCFHESSLARLCTEPLEQIWRDHLLAGSLLRTERFSDGFYAIVYPQNNDCCANAVEQYHSCLVCTRTFDAWKLEDVVGAIRANSNATWIDELADRYLNFDKLVLR